MHMKTQGMWAHTLAPIDYQNLIDRGWRRSGKYCYKPTMNLTCCPLYTIRCEATKFTLTKSQKKVLKKVHKFLATGKKPQPSQMHSSANNSDHEMEVTDYSPDADMQGVKRIEKVRPIDQTGINEENVANEDSDLPNQTCDTPPLDPQASSKSSQSPVSSNKPSPVKSSNTSRPQCRKAKEVRKERKLQKLLKRGLSQADASAVVTHAKKGNEPKSLEEFLLDPLPSQPAHKLELRLVPSTLDNPLFCQSFDESYEIYKKYQTTIHQDSPEKCSTKQFTRFLVTSPFQLRIVTADPESESFMATFKESHDIYVKYQMTIHKDTDEECNEESFRNFLLETPFEHVESSSSSSRSAYGSFHHQYWLDDKLIAVGVVDILPYCISSVYFFYDPDYSFLSLGTYAALREIALTRELNTKYKDLQYYYMGYYIHSCVKMRYKGQYVPSFLLCPETYIFQPIEKCRPTLDVSKYHRLEEDPNKDDVDGVVNLREILILYDRTKMMFTLYKTLQKKTDDEEEVKEYAKFVGRKCYRKIMLYRDS
ncbi:hypothetical protein JTE90_006678 [Oedothorax gibbosus]|uniref:Arginyl-tRNA--protein transferase 1 n=1 Tax=Oedothorax gibbosus TaxID=931172 RepID=A0AAV6V3Q9_9ARAC|nr:hypothetical protein JTE90_006678 [Oedothorax gibbosus]